MWKGPQHDPSCLCKACWPDDHGQLLPLVDHAPSCYCQTCMIAYRRQQRTPGYLGGYRAITERPGWRG